jgi:hypothetical protein
MQKSEELETFSVKELKQLIKMFEKEKKLTGMKKKDLVEHAEYLMKNGKENNPSGSSEKQALEHAPASAVLPSYGGGWHQFVNARFNKREGGSRMISQYAKVARYYDSE